MECSRKEHVHSAGVVARPDLGPPGPGNSELPLFTEHREQKPSHHEENGTKQDERGWAGALAPESLFAELLFPGEVFTNQPFRVWFLGGRAESP